MSFNTHRTSAVKLLAVALALLLLFNGAWTGIESGSFGSSSSYDEGEKLDVYVRIFVPGDNTPFKSIGHYDLMIKGTIRFRGKTFVNPVFSYRMEDSRLDVFNESDTGKVYAHSRGDYYYDCSIYQLHLKIGSSARLNSFLSSLNSMISSSSNHPNTSRGLKCRIKSSSIFSRYRAKSTNCFCAVAVWTNSLGDSTLWNYYKGVHSGVYTDYFPTTIVSRFSDKISLRYG